MIQISEYIKGAQGPYKLINGHKFVPEFPNDWAKSHAQFVNSDLNLTNLLGPHCVTCVTMCSKGSVFIGYCGNCITEYANRGTPRGYLVLPETHISQLTANELWDRYPYLDGITLDEIGDEETEIEITTDDEIYKIFGPLDGCRVSLEGVLLTPEEIAELRTSH